MRTRPQANVGCIGHLALHGNEMLDNIKDWQVRPLQQELAGENGTVQFAQRQNTFCHSLSFSLWHHLDAWCHNGGVLCKWVAPICDLAQASGILSGPLS